MARYSFLSLVTAGLILPSDGGHGAFNPKSLLLLASLASCLLLSGAAPSPQGRQGVAAIGVFGVACAALLAFWVNGLGQQGGFYSNQLDQFKVFFVTVTAALMGYWLVSQAVVPASMLLRTALYANMAYNLFKIATVLLHLLGLVNIFTMMEWTHIRVMTMDIAAGVLRFQTSVDIATPYLVHFALHSERFGVRFSRRFTACFVTLALLSVMLSFSRYLLAVMLCVAAGGWLQAALRTKVQAALAALAVFCLCYMVLGGAFFAEAIDKRLFSSDNYYSDLTRALQVEALMEEVADYPLCGKGLGAYSPRCIRDQDLLHSYEVQWVAFAMQLGAFGLVALGIAAFVVIWPLLLESVTFYSAMTMALFGLWLLSGFTNPYLISLTSGIVYLLFALAARRG